MPVIKHFDVVEDCRFGILSCLKPAVPRQLILETREEALDDGIVVAVAFAALTLDHAMVVEDRLVACRAVEHATIAVMDEATLRLPMLDRHGQRIVRERLVHSLPHRPAHDTARIKIDQDRQVEPTFAGRDERRVAGPEAIRPIGVEVALEQVRGGRSLFGSVDRTEAPHAFGRNPMRGTEPGDAMAAARFTGGEERPPELTHTVVLARLRMNPPDAIEQTRVRPGALTDGAAPPVVIAAAGDTQGAAHGRHGEYSFMLADRGVPHEDSLAKNLAVFFKKAISSLS